MKITLAHGVLGGIQSGASGGSFRSGGLRGRQKTVISIAANFVYGDLVQIALRGRSKLMHLELRQDRFVSMVALPNETTVVDSWK